MSLNTMAYNTSIALGALFGGLFVDHLGRHECRLVRPGADGGFAAPRARRPSDAEHEAEVTQTPAA